MAEITAAAVRALREETTLPMMDCKAALVEAGGDMEMAKDILRLHGIVWPAMLLAAGYDPPRGLFVHGYFTSDGQKITNRPNESGLRIGGPPRRTSNR